MGELVEGIGDEVLFFVGFLALSLAGVVYLSMRPRLRGRAPTFERATPPPRAEDASERGREEEDGERDPAPVPPSTDQSDRSNLRARAPNLQAHSPTPPSQGVATDNDQSSESTSITVRLIVGEGTRSIAVSMETTLNDIRNEHFRTELSQNRSVRFIYHGRVLSDSTTLSQLNITNNCSLHVHIGRPDSERNGNVEQEQEVFDISRFFIPLIGLILLFVWVGMLSFPAAFSFASKLFLFVLSLGYVFLTYYTVTQ